jgi:hypothetical protein|tara:strand:+ start:8878 stop:9219 length:342 start_codon:yes stop_codon:yes gene_type:complete
MIEEDDKVFTMYKQYKALIHKDAVEGANHVYGTDQLAAWLTVAHTLDHAVSVLADTKTYDAATTLDKAHVPVNATWKEDKRLTNKKKKKAPQTLLETYSNLDSRRMEGFDTAN